MSKKAITRILVLLACLAVTLVALPVWAWWVPAVLLFLLAPVIVRYGAEGEEDDDYDGDM
jgi:hypothetical protein